MESRASRALAEAERIEKAAQLRVEQAQAKAAAAEEKLKEVADTAQLEQDLVIRRKMTTEYDKIVEDHEQATQRRVLEAG